ncbi:hypothetical protein BDN72DRAFT_861986 [Pluteus cervinus]|uniref:Uncharacterized protein n=1 Tax=Pluteus cervinus TaxID=181527 RepID=A0ACD3AE75_9AGAR|nr:hypothetical protein BDN72DRAFT_861986 [Pluteus cervinus]
MPKHWTTVEQKAWLTTKLPGFVEARGRSRSTAYAKGVHRAFSEQWPEVDEMTPVQVPNKAWDDALLALKKKRSGILTWLQRNSTQRGRLANTAVKLLLRNKGIKRRRAYQPGEIYNKLYPDNVNAVYQERKVEGLTKGQRLNLIKKISDELYEAETEEVKEEVAEEQVKSREALRVVLDDDEVEAALDEVTRQEYVDELPELMNSVLGEIRKFCPDWGFLVLASGPMPKLNNATHVFDVYAGPKTDLGDTFPDAHEDFDGRVRVPFGKFVREETLNTAKHDAARKALDALRYKVTPESDDEKDAIIIRPGRQTTPPTRPTHKSRRSIPRPTKSPSDTMDEDDEEYEDLDEEVSPESEDESGASGLGEGGGDGSDDEVEHSGEGSDDDEAKARDGGGSDDEGGGDPKRDGEPPNDEDGEEDEAQHPRCPPLVLNPSDANSNSAVDQRPLKLRKHPLSVYPLEEPSSGSEESSFEEEFNQKAPSTRGKPSTNAGLDSDQKPRRDPPEVLKADKLVSQKAVGTYQKIATSKGSASDKLPTKNSLVSAAKRTEVSNKRIETRKVNDAKKAEAAAKKEAEEKEEAMKKAEAAKRLEVGRKLEAAKAAKAAKKADAVKKAAATKAAKKAAKNVEGEMAGSGENVEEKGAMKKGKVARKDAATDTLMKASKLTAVSTGTAKARSKTARAAGNDVGADELTETSNTPVILDDIRTHNAKNGAPTLRQTRATASRAKSTTGANTSPPKPKGAKSKGHKRSLEGDEISTAPTEEPATKRPRRGAKVLEPGEEVPLAVQTRKTRSRRA